MQITCYAVTPPTVSNVNAFDDVFRGIALKVPQNSIEDYKIAYAWREFTNYSAAGNEPNPQPVQGIDEAGLGGAEVSVADGRVIVSGADSQPVVLYDMTGRVLGKAEEGVGAAKFDVPAAGTYLLRVGSHPARKVVVIR